MNTLLFGSMLLSIFHALIPSHWLPVLAVAKQSKWSVQRTLWVTFLAGLAHVLSTIALGLVFAWMGHWLDEQFELFTRWASPILLVGLGLFYIYQHYRHHHFHLHRQSGNYGVVLALMAAMFLSPCLEIEGYFLAAGAYGWTFTLTLATVYGLVTVIGMLVWMRLALLGLQKIDWHAWEHSAGLITGAVLAISGILMLFIA